MAVFDTKTYISRTFFHLGERYHIESMCNIIVAEKMDIAPAIT
jgi:hypothetical protein